MYIAILNLNCQNHSHSTWSERQSEREARRGEGRGQAKFDLGFPFFSQKQPRPTTKFPGRNIREGRDDSQLLCVVRVLPICRLDSFCGRRSKEKKVENSPPYSTSPFFLSNEDDDTRRPGRRHHAPPDSPPGTPRGFSRGGARTAG